MEKMPGFLEDLILDATKEGFKIEVDRHEASGTPGVYTTIVRMSHPSSTWWKYVERGYPDFLHEIWHRESFADHKVEVMTPPPPEEEVG